MDVSALRQAAASQPVSNSMSTWVLRNCLLVEMDGLLACLLACFLFCLLQSWNRKETRKKWELKQATSFALSSSSPYFCKESSSHGTPASFWLQLMSSFYVFFFFFHPCVCAISGTVHYLQQRTLCPAAAAPTWLAVVAALLLFVVLLVRFGPVLIRCVHSCDIVTYQVGARERRKVS